MIQSMTRKWIQEKNLRQISTGLHWAWSSMSNRKQCGTTTEKMTNKSRKNSCANLQTSHTLLFGATKLTKSICHFKSLSFLCFTEANVLSSALHVCLWHAFGGHLLICILVSKTMIGGLRHGCWTSLTPWLCMICTTHCQCAKSHMPFECFANENHKLGNEPKLMWHLREVRLKILWCNPLFTEMCDAST